MPTLSANDFGTDDCVLAPDLLMLRRETVRSHAVLLSGGRFADIGPADSVVGRHPLARRIDLPDCLLMPGFVDAHQHLTQSFGKALAFGEPSEIFRRIWVPLEGSLDDELVYLTSKLAALEALRGGFTTVVDAGTRAKGDVGAIAKAAEEVGMRCVLGFICNDGPGSSDAQRQTLQDAAERHLDRYAAHPLIHPSLAISIPEAASDAMLTRVAKLCRTKGAIFQTHINEHLASIERSIVARGLRPLEHLASVDALGPQTLIAHATMLTPSEFELIRTTDTAVAYNPVASQWKGNAVAAAGQMAQQGIRFGLGTDGTRCDAFRLMDAAEACQRLTFGLANGDFSCGGGWTWLDAATTAGADAVGLGAVTGEIAIGKAADFLIVDTDVPEMRPSWDLDWELVRLGNRDQIVGVFVAGKLRLWHGWPIDWDAKALMRDVAKIAGAAVAQAPIQKLHPTAAEHRKRSARPRS